MTTRDPEDDFLSLDEFVKKNRVELPEPRKLLTAKESETLLQLMEQIQAEEGAEETRETQAGRNWRFSLWPAAASFVILFGGVLYLAGVYRTQAPGPSSQSEFSELESFFLESQAFEEGSEGLEVSEAGEAAELAFQSPYRIFFDQEL